MNIIRSLNSFSLPELFKLIEHDYKSGRLIIETPLRDRNNHRKRIYYLWFKDGYLIAISSCINQKGLIDLIGKRDWLSPAIVDRLRKLCPAGVPLGIYLHKMKLLDSEKISLIFQLQLHQVYRLFQLNEGRFRFDDFAKLQGRILTIPWLEMTGHRIKTSEVSMYALRLMESSEKFIDQLPSLSQALRKTATQSHLKLNTIERQLWDLADGKTSLLTIAKITQHSARKIKTTAFRLIAVGLLDPVFVPSQDWSHSNILHTLTLQGDTTKLSTIARSSLGCQQQTAYELQNRVARGTPSERNMAESDELLPQQASLPPEQTRSGQTVTEIYQSPRVDLGRNTSLLRTFADLFKRKV